MKLSFKFIDRYDERYLLKRIFTKQDKCEQGIWLTGPQTTGKSELINEIVKSLDSLTVIHSSFISNEYSYFANVLSGYFNSNNKDNNMLVFISRFYRIIDSELTQNYGDYINSSVLTKIKIANDLIYHTEISIKDIIIKYILECKVQAIVFDDFEYCDYYSLLIVREVISELLSYTDCKFCFITSSDIVLPTYISEFLIENLDTKNIVLNNFGDVFFYTEFIHSCKGLPNDIISSNQIYKLFLTNNGNIGKFKQDINHLVYSGAVYSEKSVIDSYIFNKERNKHPFLNNSYLKILVILAIIFELPTSSQLYIDSMCFIHSIPVNNTFFVFRIYEFIDTLLKEEIMIQNDDNISIKNQIISEELLLSFKDNDPILLKNITKFILQYYKIKPSWLNQLSPIHKYIIEFNCYNLINDESILIIAEKLINYYFSHDSFDSIERISKSILPYAKKISFNIFYMVLVSLYRIGNYEYALKYLNQYAPNNLTNEDLIDYYIIKGKIEFILLNQDSISSFEEAKALSISIGNIPKIIECVNLLFMAYSENRGTLSKAKKEFIYGYSIKEKCVSSVKLCRNALNVFNGEKALSIMKYGKDLARELHDNLEEQKCLHNIEFIKLVSINAISETEKIKNNYYRIFEYFSKQRLPHESAYTLNNYSVILMMNGDLEKAENYLRKARVLCASEYSKHVITCNILIASLYNKSTTSTDYKSILLEHYDNLYACNIADDRIIRKYLINFSIIAIKHDDYDLAKFFLEKCRCHLGNSPSIARYNMLCETINAPLCCSEYTIPNNSILYYQDLPFEPWLLSFGHD